MGSFSEEKRLRSLGFNPENAPPKEVVGAFEMIKVYFEREWNNLTLGTGEGESWRETTWFQKFSPIITANFLDVTTARGKIRIENHSIIKWFSADWTHDQTIASVKTLAEALFSELKFFIEDKLEAAAFLSKSPRLVFKDWNGGGDRAFSVKFEYSYGGL